jgi:hypothetical protein
MSCGDAFVLQERRKCESTAGREVELDDWRTCEVASGLDAVMEHIGWMGGLGCMVMPRNAVAGCKATGIQIVKEPILHPFPRTGSSAILVACLSFGGNVGKLCATGD